MARRRRKICLMSHLVFKGVPILLLLCCGSLSSDMNGMDPDVVVSTRPFRNIGLSKAAQTHRLRKLRTPSKCRECDSYVYFQGAECEEVSPASCLLTTSNLQRETQDADVQLSKHLTKDQTRLMRLTSPPLSSVFPGVSQALSGDFGHPMRPQEAAGPSAAVWQGLLSGSQLRQ